MAANREFGDKDDNIKEKLEITIKQTTEKPIDLLLIADPEINAINKYINKSIILVAKNFEVTVGVIAINKKEANIFEIMNLAVAIEYRGKGIGQKLINDALERIKALGGQKVIIGTGNSSIGPLALYQKLGFKIYDIKKGFFLENYKEAIWENGIRCEDMIMLEKNIFDKKG